ncbi:PREDICTED: OTU domain-containing protein 7A-like, partial [Priapulus caudatus]|uniref:ubiquitinyl hydrolase 1 n=1 Tax=Priapulus caudatus TaxID=37621 RepID=A0ABM1DPL1_PRICU
EAFAPINFGGVYLPLERLSSECHKWPLVLTYDAAHFSALVTMDTANRDPKLPVVVPLTDKSSDLLTMHFAVDVGAEFCWSDLQTEGKLPRSDLTKKQKLDLVHRYLDVVKLPVPGSVGEPPPPCASNGVVDGDVIGGGGSGERKSSLGSLESDEARSTVSTASSGSAGVVAAATADGRRPANGSVARQFSTFGRSLSKKLKHNFSFSKKHKPGRMADGARADGRDDRAATATRTKKATAAACAGLAPPAITVVQREDRSGQPTQYMLSARICTDRRFEYQEEMLRNYLNSARRRYEDERRAIELQLQRRGGGSSAGGKPVPCVNAGCALYGTITTNYLCSKCFARQKEHAATLDRARQKASTLPKFLAGKSKFYTEVSFLEREPYSGGGVARGGGAPAAVVEKDGQGGDADVRLPTLQEAALTTLHCELSGDKSKRLVAGGAGAKASSLPRSVAPPLLYSLPPPGGVVDVEQIVVTVKTAEQATKMGCAIATAGAPPARKSGSLIAAAGALPVIKVGSVIAAAAAPPAMMVGASTPTKTGSVIVTAGAPPATKAISVTATAGAPPAMKAELRYRQQKQACKTRGCHAFGEEEMEFLCSACYQEKERSQSLTPYIISHRI